MLLSILRIYQINIQFSAVSSYFSLLTQYCQEICWPQPAIVSWTNLNKLLFLRRHFWPTLTTGSNPTYPFTVLEPRDQEIGEFYAIQERCATDWEAPQLYKGRVGSQPDEECIYVLTIYFNIATYKTSVVWEQLGFPPLPCFHIVKQATRMAVPLLPLGINLSHFVMAKYLNIEEQASKTRGGGKTRITGLLQLFWQVKNRCAICVCVWYKYPWLEGK